MAVSVMQSRILRLFPIILSLILPTTFGAQISYGWDGTTTSAPSGATAFSNFGIATPNNYLMTIIYPDLSFSLCGETVEWTIRSNAAGSVTVAIWEPQGGNDFLFVDSADFTLDGVIKTDSSIKVIETPVNAVMGLISPFEKNIGVNGYQTTSCAGAEIKHKYVTTLPSAGETVPFDVATDGTQCSVFHVQVKIQTKVLCSDPAVPGGTNSYTDNYGCDPLTVTCEGTTLYKAGVEGTASDLQDMTCTNGAWSVTDLNQYECRGFCTMPALTDQATFLDGTGIQPTADEMYSGQAFTLSCDDGYTGTPVSVSLTCAEVSPSPITFGWVEDTNTPTAYDFTAYSCEPADCGTAPADPLATLSGSPTTFGSIETYTCNAGNAANGQTTYTRTCEGNPANWTSDDQTDGPCTANVCKNIPTYEFSTSNPASGDVALNALVTYTCESGYQVEGTTDTTFTIICEDQGTSGAFSSPAAKCVLIACVDLKRALTLTDPNYVVGTYSNTAEADGTYASGTTVDLSCAPGFSLSDGSNSKTYTCADTGLWDPAAPAPTCDEINCGDPTADLDLKNAMVPAGTTDFTYSASFKFTCKEGYKLPAGTFAATHTCTNSGWNPRFGTTCELIACPEFTLGENESFSDYSGPDGVGDVVTVTCDDGSEATGTTDKTYTVTCELVSEGVADWGTRTGCTQKTCAALTADESVTADTVIVTDAVEGGIQAFTCNSEAGYALIAGSPTELTCTRTGTDVAWDRAAFPCEKHDCGDPTPGAYAAIATNPDDNLFGSEVTYECNTGFIIDTGNLTATCTFDGWSSQLACKAAVCSSPTNPQVNTEEAGSWETSGTDLTTINNGDTVTLTCNNGYRLVANTAASTCGVSADFTSAEYTPALDTCEVITCTEASITTDLTIAADSNIMSGGFSTAANADGSYNHGTTGELSCDTGFTPRATDPNPQTITCNAGTWEIADVALITCVVIECDNPDPLLPANTKIESPMSPYIYPEEIKIICDQGFQAANGTLGTATVTCTGSADNGGWNIDIASSVKCDPMKCDKTTLIEPDTNAVVGVDYATISTESGTSISYTCNENEGFVSSTGGAGTTPNPVICVSDGAGGVGWAPVFSAALWGCEKFTCDDLTPNQFTVIATPPTTSEYDDTLVLACEENYKVSTGFESTTMKCTLNGWAPADGGTQLACETAPCQALVDPANGGWTSTGDLAQPVSPDVATLTCDPDYRVKPIGGSTSTCTLDVATNTANWDPAVLECELIVCESPAFEIAAQSLPVDTSTVPDNNNKLTPGTTATMTCQDNTIAKAGFTSPTTVICQGDGTWDNPILECETTQCSDLVMEIMDSVAGGTSGSWALDGGTEFEPGASYSASCNQGFLISEASPDPLVLSCIINQDKSKAIWSIDNLNEVDPITITCDLQTCEDPTLDSTYTAPELAMVGPTASTTYPGKYTVVDASSFTLNCAVGYEQDTTTLTLPTTITCTETGWTGDVPACKPVTCTPEIEVTLSDPQASFTDVSIDQTFGNSFTITCAEGYSTGTDATDNNPIVIFCGSDGSWHQDAVDGTVYDIASTTCTFVPCMDLEMDDTLENGVINNVDGLDGTVTEVIYSCNNGFVFDLGTKSQSRRRYCSPTDQTWDGNPGSVEPCLPLPCDDPGTIKDDSVTEFAPQDGATDHATGDVYMAVCEMGKAVSGPATVTCQATGATTVDWNPAPNTITCEDLTCPVLTAPDNGAIAPVQSTYQYSEQVTYSCNTGYTLSGDTVRTCSDDGSGNGVWNGTTAPVCNIDDCGPAPTDANAENVATTTTFGSTMTSTCKSGYERADGSTSKTYQCTTETSGVAATWTPSYENCTGKDCNAPTVSDSSKFLVSPPLQTTFGNTATFSCKPGYSGTETTKTCDATGQWVGSEPTCTPQPCLDPKDQYVKPLSKEYVFQEEATFECQLGYMRDSGDETRTCQSNKQFDGIPLVCTAVECTSLPQVDNSKVISYDTNYYYTDIVEYECNVGFELTAGNLQVTCGADGQFAFQNNIKPVCTKVNCGTPPTITNANSATFTVTTYLATASYTCKTGYKQNGGDATRRCRENKMWGGTDIVCELLTCPELTPPSNGAIAPVKTTYQYNEQVTYSCNTGYTLSGDTARTCSDDGSSNGVWTGTAPVCNVVTCTPLANPANGVISQPANGVSFEYQETATVTCNPGYAVRAPASSTITCTESGSFDSGTAAPLCLPVQCSAAPDSDGTTHTPTGPVTYPGSVTYTCQEGWEYSSGDATITCQQTQTYSGTPLVCNRKKCKSLLHVDHSTLDPDQSSFEVEDSVTYACDAGYELTSGLATLTCGLDTNWIGTYPVCSAVNCPDPGDVTNAVKTGGEFTFGNEVTYTCESGYKIAGTSVNTKTIQCQADETWSTSPADISCIEACKTDSPCGVRPCEGTTTAPKFYECSCTASFNVFQEQDCRGDGTVALGIVKHMRFIIVNIDWISALGDRSSDQYKDLKEKLLYSFIWRMNVYRDARINFNNFVFSQTNSINVDFDLVLDPASTLTDQQIVDAFYNSLFGNNQYLDNTPEAYMVKPDSVMVVDDTITSTSTSTTTSTTTTTSPTTTRSTSTTTETTTQPTSTNDDLLPLWIALGIGIPLLLLLLGCCLYYFCCRDYRRESPRYYDDEMSQYTDSYHEEPYQTRGHMVPYKTTQVWQGMPTQNFSEVDYPARAQRFSTIPYNYY